MKSYGRAPPRSIRSKLFDKGYESLSPGGGYVSWGHTPERAKLAVDNLHKKGFRAQVVSIRNMDTGVKSYHVMYLPLWRMKENALRRKKK